MSQAPCKLWIPQSKIKEISSIVPLTNISELHKGQLNTAVLEQSGFLGKLQKNNILVKTAHWRTIDKDLAGAYGFITPKQKHTLYENGLYLTTYSEVDVRYHLGTETVTQRKGIERIEVPRPDRGENLDDFVLDALDAYSLLGHKSNEREESLIFYQSLNPNKRYSD